MPGRLSSGLGSALHLSPLPLPTFLLFGFGVGAAAALAGARELRFTPRHALGTDSFRAFALFVGLLLLPVSCYFYVFHGDWFLLYSVDARSLPSALVLVGIVIECGVAVAGFASGAALARSQRTNVGVALVTLSFVGASAVALVWRDRLTVVGSYSQYRGDYGLEPVGGALLHGVLALGGFVCLGALYLVARIRHAQRRNGA